MTEAIEKYLSHLRLRNASENTIRSYRSYLLELAATCEVNVSQLDVEHIESYLARLGRRPIAKATMRRALATLKSFSEWLVCEGILRENPASAFRAPRCSQHVHVVATEQEIRNLMDAPIRTNFPERDRLILELLYGSGLRCDELANLRLADLIGPDVLLVSKGKGNKQRQVLLTDRARAALKSYLDRREQILSEKRRDEWPCGQARKPKRKVCTALFFGLRGPEIDALDPRSVRRTVVALAHDAGLPWLRPHDLRRAFATHMDQHGAPRIVISRLLGHSKQSITDLYIAKASPERLKMAYNRVRANNGQPKKDRSGEGSKARST